jgi:hypothetical protein
MTGHDAQTSLKSTFSRWPSLRASARLYCSSDECRKRLIRKRMPGARPCLIAAGEGSRKYPLQVFILSCRSPFILAGDILGDARTGKNGRHALVGMLRSALQEFYSIHKLRYLYAQQAKIWDLPTNGNDYGCIAIAAACHFGPVNA